MHLSLFSTMASQVSEGILTQPPGQVHCPAFSRCMSHCMGSQEKCLFTCIRLAVSWSPTASPCASPLPLSFGRGPRPCPSLSCAPAATVLLALFPVASLLLQVSSLRAPPFRQGEGVGMLCPAPGPLQQYCFLPFLWWAYFKIMGARPHVYP